MAKKDDIFRLAQTLDGNERRYFRLQAQMQVRKKTPQYLLLFDALCELESFDPAKLKALLVKKDFSGTLEVEKNYLQKQILRAMRMYHAGKKVDMQVKDLIMDGTFLFEKKLYQRAASAFRKARKLATKHEIFTALIEIGIWERRLLKLLEQRKRKEKAAKLHAELDQRMRQLNEFIHLHHVYDHFYLSAVAGGQNANAEQQVQLAELRMHPLLAEAPDTFRGRLIYYQIQGIYAQVEKRWHVAKGYFLRALDQWQAHPEIRKDELRSYTILLANYLHSCTLDDDYAAIPEILARTEGIRPRVALERLSLQQLSFHYKLIWMLNSSETSEDRELLDSAARWLRKHRKELPLSTVYSFWLNFAIVHFLNGRSAETLRYLRRLLQQKNKEIRQDIYDFARLLELIVHYELGSHDLLPYRMRAFRRQYGSGQAMPGLETATFQFLQEALKLPAGQSDAADLHELATRIAALRAVEQKAGQLEIYCWAEARRRGVPIARLVLEERTGNKP